MIKGSVNEELINEKFIKFIDKHLYTDISIKCLTMSYLMLIENSMEFIKELSIQSIDV